MILLVTGRPLGSERVKVVAVAYKRLLARGSKCSDVTGKVLVFWKTSR